MTSKTKFTNLNNVPLPLAVWLVDDTYDYVQDPNYISATQFLIPTRQLVLQRRLESITKDIGDSSASSVGNSVHDSVEKSWKYRGKENLEKLGFREREISKLIVDPDLNDIPQLVKDGFSYIIFETRGLKEIDDFVVGGKFDIVADGVLYDIKTTSTFAWNSESNHENYKIQGSIYRWLFPDLITSDFIRICFVFKDWSKNRARNNPDYPQTSTPFLDIPLMTIEETERFIKGKINEIKKNSELPDDELIRCTDEEMWLDPPKYRYYRNPEKVTGRATRVLDTREEARLYMSTKGGGKGVILEDIQTPKRCKDWCDAYELCTQKDLYFSHD